MPNSIRIRTQVGVDKSIRVLLNQDFEYLEILSLKILQSQIYNRQCSDYGVVVGRVTSNNGYGIPNAKISIFIPLDQEDETNPIISELYPYKSLSDVNEDGYRYNLLPYVKSYSEHVPTGTFFNRKDVLTEPSLIEVFDKYFRYTARTNDSGDFMIFGVPVGQQTIHVDIDLSDIGEFSLSPQDLIRMGVATESQISGTKFRSSTNLAELPQIISINRVIQVEPLWGQPEICNLGITRTDFDLTDEANITITPTAIFMGSIFSDIDTMALKSNCKPRLKQGELCNLIAGPGEILTIRQTIFQDTLGRPFLESFDLESGGQVIDENGTWLVDIPMNLDFVTTNEFGEKVLSNDPKIGVPTKAKYRFKIKWNQSPTLNEDTKRGYYLVPNIREFGWDSGGNTVINQTLLRKSYAFSINWDDYVDPQSGINCEDSFYEMAYNKVYSVSQLIDKHRQGTLPNRFVSIKNILDESCESENNRFPTNDAVYRGDIIFLIFLFFISIFQIIMLPLVVVIHVLYVLIIIVKYLGIFLAALSFYFLLKEVSSAIAALNIGVVTPAGPVSPNFKLFFISLKKAIGWGLATVAFAFLWKKLKDVKLKPFSLPIMLYDQCEFCDCNQEENDIQDSYESEVAGGMPSLPGAGSPSQSTSGVGGGAGAIGGNSSDISNNVQGQISEFYTNNYFLNLVSSQPIYSFIGQSVAGQEFLNPPTDTPVCGSLVPNLTLSVDSSGNEDYVFTSSLNLGERINLFNTKAKFFDEIPNNPGGGVNQIKVSFLTGGTMTSDIDAHYDNIVFLMLTPDSLQSFNDGDIITFQNPSFSKDVNVVGGPTNQYGNNSITGTPVNTAAYPVTVNYVKPDGTPGSVNYTIPTPNSADTNYHKYPIDLEYFQVITAMTYSNFASQQGTTLTNSLNKRFLNNTMWFLKIYKDGAPDNQSEPITGINPLTAFDDYQNQVCLFLVRGVDPYSSKQPVTYDLSKIFGHSSYNNVLIKGFYKLNQPIVGGFKNIRHNLTNSTDLDSSYSNSNLYFKSFNYQPSTTQFSGFGSNLPSYYSNLDNNLNSVTFGTCCNLSPLYLNTVLSQTTYGARAIGNITYSSSSPTGWYGKNAFVYEFNTPVFSSSSPPPLPLVPYYAPTPNNTLSKNRGYFVSEIVEGGGLMIMDVTIRDTTIGSPAVVTAYLSTSYSTATTVTYPTTIKTNRKTVMRSDRLPTSTNVFSNCEIDYLLQNNPNFSIYVIGENGILPSQTTTIPFLTQGPYDGNTFTSNTLNNTVINSLNECQDSVPLKCYEFVGDEFRLKTGDACKSTEYDGSPKLIWKTGCYKLVTRILLSIPTDFLLIAEWAARTKIVFGACRNVFSHVFTNNWINGSLYAFAFKNNRIFNNQNQPTSDICDRTVYFDPTTNNFYYRSSPYYSGTTEQYFCGSPGTESTVQLGNLRYPTTLIDLGPRNFYLQEIIMSDDYDGYVVSQLRTTTFGDVSEIFNIFMLSRMANSGFWSQVFGSGGNSVLKYFDSRGRFQVDADYAQMISINSELGVNEFQSESYPDVPGTGPIYFSNGGSENGIFGIFFSSDTQVRDFISPKRTIIIPSGASTNDCTFSYFNVKTQKVPFYQWQLKDNPSTANIFGAQSNTWFTEPLDGQKYFSNYYQKMDRLTESSRYFRTLPGITNNSYNKGYIYNVNNSGQYSSDLSFQDYNNLVNGKEKHITVGGPFHFYFGLKKGRSAWDRFARKWIGFENITN
jgi:hypothetical protein